VTKVRTRVPAKVEARLGPGKAALLAFVLIFVLGALLMPDWIYEGWREPVPF